MPEYTEIFNQRGHLYNEAVSLYPYAREAERRELIERLQPLTGERIVDAPAGGGYLAEGLKAYSEDTVDIVCVEPSARFAEAMGSEYALLNEPLDNIASLAPNSVDAIASLVGLHHFQDKRPIYREWQSLIRPGGRLVIADVEANTATANFLNIFVDANTEGGHDGIFFHPGEWTEQLSDVGFVSVEEACVEVPWLFPDITAMTTFCSSLFALKAMPAETLQAALSDYLGYETRPDCSIMLNWQLRYARAVCSEIE